MALDGFGAGAERIDEDDDEEDSDSDTEEELTDGEAEDIEANSDEEVVEDAAEKQASYFIYIDNRNIYLHVKSYSVRRNISLTNLTKRDNTTSLSLPSTFLVLSLRVYLMLVSLSLLIFKLVQFLLL